MHQIVIRLRLNEKSHCAKGCSVWIGWGKVIYIAIYHHTVFCNANIAFKVCVFDCYGQLANATIKSPCPLHVWGEFNNSQWPDIGWPWLMHVNFTSCCSMRLSAFFFRIGVGYVNFFFLIFFFRRLSLTDSFWSCFCCSSRSFFFVFIAYPQCLCTWCHTVLSFVGAAWRKNWGVWWKDVPDVGM